ncbi:probable dolichyl pyrophosphate Glc1Man9GlcNAc2 alpha-1,3-glucosyltransferase [Sycon ciliatum]|uniref:probable dolichyl pyrophosphate Glc1Man9GlcNAc2 alpha-1,3-glucosyltransferase n=1 Tax=Sycon ciliatum TaxID=27933 RepID=UPI0020AD21D8|eukprot:scpid59944/ scgid1099/ Probable dolichyl pyrophosphate Glc1Man9GlcNAc2 alpha-1,3-glucosyltransferase; Asparagine-linked glycosylation protein 8 homolog; Dol-P-Glc:Glc(1)Man(9)GlcNAc(2)-PP-dolichyl alpha-1,3-glucosyltransferase; Dolichyl-P-Glc:Glc1Man9GlcNAc2-PP-dolichyl glucosyltransferase
MVSSKDLLPFGWGIILSVAKVLLFRTYRSTDFEVHRNWLAITNSLPVSKWYFENTSEWTLDYPPFFAWFEWLLSQVAVLIDPQIVSVTNLNYAAPLCVAFQRGSVILTDFVLVYAVQQYCQWLRKKSKHVLLEERILFLCVLILCNFGLLIVDHIHFQYNGFLMGIWLLSITRMMEGRVIAAAFLFAALLNFKHIFLYVSPAYFIYLFRVYCFPSRRKDSLTAATVSIWTFSFSNLVKLGVVVVAVFAVSFGPFIYMQQLPQVLSRLFPFKRGLCHAYWAPNIWALYNVADKAAVVLARRLGMAVSLPTASLTSGLVGDVEHVILPAVPPIATAICTLLTILPSMLHVWRRPVGPESFLRCLVLCAFSSFLFGWHVHEKAIILITIPMSLLAIEQAAVARIYLLLSITGHYSLFPLLFQPAETPIKVLLLLLVSIWSIRCVKVCVNGQGTTQLNALEKLYLLGLVPLFVYCDIVHAMLGLHVTLPFLPLLLTSVYCAIGVVYAWLLFYADTLSGRWFRSEDKVKET